MGSLSFSTSPRRCFLHFCKSVCLCGCLSTLCQLRERKKSVCRFCAPAQNTHTPPNPKKLLSVPRISKGMHSNGRDPATLEALCLILSHNLISERLGPWFGGIYSLSGLLERAWVVRLGHHRINLGSSTAFYVSWEGHLTPQYINYLVRIIGIITCLTTLQALSEREWGRICSQYLGCRQYGGDAWESVLPTFVGGRRFCCGHT